MNTQIPAKLAALAVALMINSLLVVGVAFLFNSQVQLHVAVASLTHTAVATVSGAV